MKSCGREARSVVLGLVGRPDGMKGSVSIRKVNASGE